MPHIDLHWWGFGLLLWGGLSGLMTMAFSWRTPEEWVTWAKTKPRIAGLLAIAEGMGINVPQTLLGLQLLAKGKAAGILASQGISPLAMEAKPPANPTSFPRMSPTVVIDVESDPPPPVFPISTTKEDDE